ncbi:MAG TPA: FAD:protein FMN transferase [Chromatiaceae bacterium]|nr:FAD:protein FMN transferase [Chromatiaceae bacterium]
MKRPILIVLMSFLLLSACQQPTETLLTGDTQGTSWHLKMVLDGTSANPEEIGTAVAALFSRIDERFSNWREDSELARFNRQETTEWQSLSPEVVQLTRLAREIHDKTGGCYDPTVQPLSELWGFAREEQRVPAPGEIQAVLAHIGMDMLEIDVAGNRLRKRDPALELSLDSIAQGYTIGAMAQLLEDRGIHNYLAEIGGEMKVKGHKANGGAWRVAVEKPKPLTREVQRILELQRQDGIAVMTSGTYRNYFEADGKTYSHIIDPRTGMPVTHQLLSTTVLHPDPTLADAWSTALLCVGETEGLRIAAAEGLRALFIHQEGEQLKETLSPAFAQYLEP